MNVSNFVCVCVCERRITMFLTYKKVKVGLTFPCTTSYLPRCVLDVLHVTVSVDVCVVVGGGG